MSNEMIQNNHCIDKWQVDFGFVHATSFAWPRQGRKHTRTHTPVCICNMTWYARYIIQCVTYTHTRETPTTLVESGVMKMIFGVIKVIFCEIYLVSRRPCLRLFQVQVWERPWLSVCLEERRGMDS